MTKLRAFIVDDEPLARSNIASLLRLDPDIDLAGECSSGVDAPAAIRAAKPDLLFLDVQMPESDGFDVLELLGNHAPPAVVFVTAYDQYAIRAFEAGALDYLLKPFDNARFDRALTRAKQKVAAAQDLSATAGHPRHLAGPLSGRIPIKSAGEVLFISPADIDWIEAADYYAALHVGASNADGRKKTHLLRRSMADLEQDLDPAAFCRIHRSTIVNLSRVRSLTLGEDGEYHVLLEDSTTLRLSRSYRKQLQTRLGIRSDPD